MALASSQSFGARLKRERLARVLTQEALAERAGAQQAARATSESLASAHHSQNSGSTGENAGDNGGGPVFNCVTIGQNALKASIWRSL